MTTANWTRINSTLHDVLQMISRIEMQNNIAFFNLPDLMTLPRIHNKPGNHKVYKLPTNEQLQNVIDQALKVALYDANKIGVLVSAGEISFCELSKRNISSRVKTISNFEDIDNSEEEDNLNIDFAETVDCTYFRDYSDVVDEIDGNSRFVQVLHTDGSKKVLSKGSVVWRMTQSIKPLSKDRLKRVQTPKEDVSECSKNKGNPKTTTQSRQTKAKKIDLWNDLCFMDEIQIGEYCLFRKDEESIDIIEENFYKHIVVGMILAFKYITGKNDKEKQYSLEEAPVIHNSLNQRGIEVLALWYSLNGDLTLQNLSNPSFFININN